MEKYTFEYNERLGIEIPIFNTKWEHFSQEEQHQIIYRWENVRAQIPDRIKELEKMIQNVSYSYKWKIISLPSVNCLEKYQTLQAVSSI